MSRKFDPTEPELMDRPQAVSLELERDLDNLVSLNKHFGSHRLLLSFAARWLQPGGTYRILDLATGAGDLPRELVLWARARNIRLTVDAVDFQASTLAIAQGKSAGFPEIHWKQADVLSFTTEQPYDLVLCSLALHHFSDADAVQVLRQCAALSARWVLVSDLERSLFTQIGVWLLTQFVYRDPMTRFDARVSTERSFSRQELLQMATEAGWLEFQFGRFLFSRQAVWMERR